MQILGSKAAGGDPGRRLSAAISGATAMLEAVTGALPPVTYSNVVLRLLATPEDSVKRRALRLFESGLSRATEANEIDAAMSFCSQVGHSQFCCQSFDTAEHELECFMRLPSGSLNSAPDTK